MAIEWKLVPMHPTEEMIQATLDTGLYHDGEEAARAVLIDEYKAMVKAAPPAPQAASEPVAGLSGGAEREALIERLKAQSLAHRYEAETDSADLIDEAVAALHSTGKPDGEVATVTLPRALMARMLMLEVNELHRLIDTALAAR